MNNTYEIVFTPKPVTYMVDAEDEYKALHRVSSWFSEKLVDDLTRDIDISITQVSGDEPF